MYVSLSLRTRRTKNSTISSADQIYDNTNSSADLIIILIAPRTKNNTNSSESKFLGSSLWTQEFHPLESKKRLESNPPKSRSLVHGLTVRPISELRIPKPRNVDADCPGKPQIPPSYLKNGVEEWLSQASNILDSQFWDWP